MKYLLLIVLILIPSSLSADMARDLRLMRMSFLSGFEAALTMGEDQINACLKDYDLAYKIAMNKADRYVKVVERMNR